MSLKPAIILSLSFKSHMKKILPLIIFCWSLTVLNAQSVYEGYTDGQLYVQADAGALKQIMSVNPRKLPLEAFPYLSELISKYKITRITRPFAEAKEDAMLPFVLKLEFKASAQVGELQADLKKLKQVRYCEKVPLMKVDAIPNEGIPSHLAQINAANAWNVFNGNSTITIAIIDNAVMWTHADLVQNTYTNTAEIAGNNVDDDNNGYVDDVNGWDATDWDNNANPTLVGMNHGTHCAGIAAGRTDNGIGIASIGWNLKMIPVKCQTDNGSTNVVANGYEGIIYAAKAKARIISCSWGGSGFSATEQAIINYAWNKGCIVFASAGNANSSTQNYPGAYSNVYCVAAINPTDVKSSYSNYGTWVDIAAPGDNINSTVPYTGATPAYLPLSGTSMATPMVAGLAGLMLSKSPNMTRNNVLNCISTTAVNIYSLTGNASYVTNSQLGAGRIDAYAAMLCASTFSALPPVANFTAFPRMTCPLTAVQFNDSSLYVPSAWSWTFQSGTPATSTSSNPSVNWANPGTYSVAMTCSNAFGASAVTTKTAYITVAGPIALPFSEGFENANFLPANWSEKNVDNDVIFWSRRTNLGGFGTSTACAMFDNFNFNAALERDEMRSPKFSFSNVATARLRFDVAYARYNATYSDTLEVRVSTNCGASWSSIYLKGGTQLATASDVGSQFIPTNTQWRRDTIDVSALTAGQGNVMFAFVNRGQWGQPIYLDNINLTFPTPSLQVTHPASVCVSNPVTFSNTSSGAASYSWTFPGAASGNAGTTSAVATYSAPGTYSVLLVGVNGSNSVTLTRTVSVASIPSLSVGSATICSGFSVGLGAGGASTYTWSSIAGVIGTSAFYIASPSVTAIYTVTGANGVCTSSVISTVSVNTSPSVTVNSPSICPGASAVLTASGASTFSWNTGSTNAQISVSPTASAVYTITGFNGLCSDTRTTQVTVLPVPVLSITPIPGSMCVGDNVVLYASGAQSYSWSPINTSNTLNVIVQGPTAVILTGFIGSCQSQTVITLTPVPAPVLSISSAPSGTICPGQNVLLTASGGSSYLWPGGVSSPVFNTIINSNTLIVLNGSNGVCTRTAGLNIITWPSLSLSVSPPTPSFCAGSAYSINASGASTYTWSTGATGATTTLSLNTSGSIMLVGSSNGCNKTLTIPLTVWPKPAVTLSAANASCYATCNGSINAAVFAGTSPYSYSLSSGCTQSICTSLCAGLYTMQVSDAKGCTISKTVTITEPPAITNTIMVQAPTCGNCSNGTVTLVSGGGIPAYTYSWTPAVSSSSVASNLQNGCYTVTVRDQNACESTTLACLLNTTSLEDFLSSKLQRIYPNPAQEVLTVEVNQELEFHLYTVVGQLLRRGICAEGNTEIYVGDLTSGIYLLKLTDGQSDLIRKIIIE